MKHYYFIGIGGIGMSGLAKILLTRGDTISGSDIKRNEQTEKLEGLGVTIFYGQNNAHIDSKVDTVVYTSAIPDSNPDLMAAREQGIETMSRPELLNKIMTDKKGIAVTGTHGKTTVSSMLSLALIEAGLDPSVVVGAEINEISSNAQAGKGDYTVAEVCEYNRAFLDIHPFAAIITNVDADHLDCYKDIDDIKKAFTKFVGQIDPSGFVVYCGDNANAVEVVGEYTGTALKYGEAEDSDYRMSEIVFDETGSHFNVIFDGKSLGDFSLKVPGKHNILNATAVIATAHHLSADLELVARALARFGGAERRFQYMGELAGAIIIDDYAHHPTEIKATLAAARDRYPKKRIIAVFQPHQHSRTKLLLDDFANAFGDADLVILPEIYAVRDTEEDIKSVSSSVLAVRINQISAEKALFIPEFAEVENEIRRLATNNDIIITIGAGPVNQVAKDLI